MSYPWSAGDPLLAADLNAAIAGAGGGMYLPITGGTVTGKTTFLVTPSPASPVPVTITGSTVAPPPPLASIALEVIGQNSGNVRQTIGAFGGNAMLSFRRSEGTASAPTATGIGNIGAIQGFGYSPTAGWNTNVTSVSINLAAAAVFTDTSWPTQITFSTTPVNATSVAEAMRVSPSGNLLIGTTTDAGYRLDVVGDIRTSGRISPLLTNAANDGAAASAGVPIGAMYRNGNAVQVRLV